MPACKIPAIVGKTENKIAPANYNNSQDVNTATVKWKEYFTDPYLVALIDTALKNNQELNITLQEIEITKMRYAPGRGVPALCWYKGGIGIDKVGRYASRGPVKPMLKLRR